MIALYQPIGLSLIDKVNKTITKVFAGANWFLGFIGVVLFVPVSLFLSFMIWFFMQFFALYELIRLRIAARTINYDALQPTIQATEKSIRLMNEGLKKHSPINFKYFFSYLILYEYRRICQSYLDALIDKKEALDGLKEAFSDVKNNNYIPAEDLLKQMRNELAN